MGSVGAWVYPSSCRGGTAVAMWPVVQVGDEWGAETSEITEKNSFFSFRSLSRSVLATNWHIYQQLRLLPDCKTSLLSPKHHCWLTRPKPNVNLLPNEPCGEEPYTFRLLVLPVSFLSSSKRSNTDESVTYRELRLDNTCYGWLPIQGLQQKNFQENYKEKNYEKHFFLWLMK